MARATIPVELTLQELRDLTHQQIVALGKTYFMGKPIDVLSGLSRLIDLQKAVVAASRDAAAGK
jgi:hypothetical protein